MAEKDIVEKTLESYEDVFADIINVLIFNGEQRVTPESLKDTGVHSQYKAGNEIHEMERDIAKLWQPANVKFALFGAENQTKSEKVMPLRLMGYDGNSYRAQLLGDGKEYYPVITIVLYFGRTHWNQPKSLGKVVSVSKELEPYFNDYRIHVFEISWLTDEQVNMFKSDFKVVADYFTQVRKNNTYSPIPQTLKHVDEVLKLLSVFGDDRRFTDTVNTKKDGKEVSNMCEWLDIVEKKNLEQGIEQGIEQGVEAFILDKLEDNYSEDEIIARLQKRFKLTEEKAKAYFEKYGTVLS